MSDRELAAVGDPACDFAQVQEMVPEIVRDGRRVRGWPEALEHYRSCGGVDVTMERIEFYRRCYGLLQFVYTQHAGARCAAATIRTCASSGTRPRWGTAASCGWPGCSA